MGLILLRDVFKTVIYSGLCFKHDSVLFLEERDMDEYTVHTKLREPDQQETQ